MASEPNMNSKDGVTLRHGAWRLALRPDLGAAIAGLWHDEVAVLRSVEPAALSGPRLGGCFPLLPYSNRLAWCRFQWQGEHYSTQPNFEDSPHSLHGVGWHRHWQVVQQGEASLTLRLWHTPDADWPFAFEAEQDFTLVGNGLQLALRITNTDAREQPAGLGWHPYFPRRAGSHIHADVAEQWNSDDTELPVDCAPRRAIDDAVETLSLDNCFGGWNHVATIRDDTHTVQLQADARWLVVFTPPGKDFFCVEPVSHLSDAIHHRDPLAYGLVALAPGQTLAAALSLTLGAPESTAPST